MLVYTIGNQFIGTIYTNEVNYLYWHHGYVCTPRIK